VSKLHVQLVFVTAYRRPVVIDEMLILCQQTTSDVCADPDVWLVEFNRKTEHAQLLIAHTLTLAISTQVLRLNGVSAYAGWLCLAISRGGASPSTLCQYIDGRARPLRPAPTCAWGQKGLANPGLKFKVGVKYLHVIRPSLSGPPESGA
jgi:REP element-mobilizing transposase RayT